MTHAYWAKSEREAAELQALGWKVGQSAIFHHNAYAVLLVWEGKGEPPIVANRTDE